MTFFGQMVPEECWLYLPVRNPTVQPDLISRYMDCLLEFGKLEFPLNLKICDITYFLVRHMADFLHLKTVDSTSALCLRAISNCKINKSNTHTETDTHTP